MILASAFLRQLQAQDFQPQPIYLLYGEEPLFLRDATQGLRQRLQSFGYQSGEVFDIEAGFDWQSLKMETQSGSLFAETRFIVLNMPKGTPGKDGSEFFQYWNQRCHESPETVMIVLCEKLDSRQLKSKWMKAIEACGVVVQAKPVPFKDVPGWIQNRGQQNGLQLSHEAASLLADRTEGNLLAADQELIKLSLLLASGEGTGQTLHEVDAQTITDNVVDQAHYQLFALSSSLLKGQLHSSLHRLQRLQQEGIEAPVVLWLLTRELRQLIELQELSAGVSFSQACKQLRIWSSQQAEYGQALRRQPLETWKSCLQLALQVDRKIKGIEPILETSEIWSGLMEIVIKMAK